MQHVILVFLDLWLDVIQRPQIYILFCVKKSDIIFNVEKMLKKYRSDTSFYKNLMTKWISRLY